ncbi:Acyltransferase [Paraoerskovia marina]|uniref:Acyltransferase n=1 Tax=Paraoerskovia marina TaxID=545619 RepID=A0A1H1QRA4_9CELL|nr:1-acyl-sn-glycerol-3-phosphate acyltransferase [Paraoerskovia marina]SDS25944.1 Acyltransferase [Paraoerskovia marina]
MNVAPPPWWVRRFVLAPVMVAIAVLLAPTSILLVLLALAVVSWALPGRLRAPRMAWMTVFYILWEATALLGFFGIWVASGFGYAMDRKVFRSVNLRFAAWMVKVLFWQIRWTLRLRISIDADEIRGLDGVPAVVVSRHAGPGDSFVLVDALLNVARREPRIVLKDTLRWDPAIDTLLSRIPAEFVVPHLRRAADDPGGSEAVGDLARTMSDDSALLLFPEGGNVTPRRRSARIAALQDAGQSDLAAMAAAMPHVMAPHVGGFLAALDACPRAGVVVVAHTGLEKLVTFGDIWRELPMDKHIVMKGWSTAPGVLPAGADDRGTWLFSEWARVDGWIDATTAELEREKTDPRRRTSRGVRAAQRG